MNALSPRPPRCWPPVPMNDRRPLGLHHVRQVRVGAPEHRPQLVSRHLDPRDLAVRYPTPGAAREAARQRIAQHLLHRPVGPVDLRVLALACRAAQEPPVGRAVAGAHWSLVEADDLAHLRPIAGGFISQQSLVAGPRHNSRMAFRFRTIIRSARSRRGAVALRALLDTILNQRLRYAGLAAVEVRPRVPLHRRRREVLELLDHRPTCSPVHLTRHARHFILQLAESGLTPALFRQILGRIERLTDEGDPTHRLPAQGRHRFDRRPDRGPLTSGSINRSPRRS